VTINVIFSIHLVITTGCTKLQAWAVHLANLRNLKAEMKGHGQHDNLIYLLFSLKNCTCLGSCIVCDWIWGSLYYIKYFQVKLQTVHYTRWESAVFTQYLYISAVIERFCYYWQSMNFGKHPWELFTLGALYMLHNHIHLLKCTNLWLCVKLRLVSVKAHMCNLYNMFQLSRLLFHFSSQEQWCSSHCIPMEMSEWVEYIESVHVNYGCVDT